MVEESLGFVDLILIMVSVYHLPLTRKNLVIPSAISVPSLVEISSHLSHLSPKTFPELSPESSLSLGGTKDCLPGEASSYILRGTSTG